jgi:NAD-dependent deacetylase
MSLFSGRHIERIVVLTGAGVSAESGLVTFRDPDGLWERHDPAELATPEAFARDPGLVYRFYNARRSQLSTVHPNAAHIALANLQRGFSGELFLVTQNVDDLHERAGSPQVCHMHGELGTMRCTKCGRRMAAPAKFDGRTRCPGCDSAGGLRPDVVWFGEMPYHLEEIDAQLADCDLFVAVGTSGVVYPAAGFVSQARRHGATTLEINRELSEVTGLFHHQRQGLATIEVAALAEQLLAG